MIKMMDRKEGFINLEILFKSKKCQVLSQKELAKYGDSIEAIFKFEEDIYFFKNLEISYYCYAELIAEELAYMFQIPTAQYDLAFYNLKKGVITKNFKKHGIKYMTGEEILTDYLITYENKKDSILKEEIEKYNSIEGIWLALSSRYFSYPNKEGILKNLMNEIIDMFIFDLLIGNTDRNISNWGIIEDQNEIHLQPVFDHAFLLDIDELFRMKPAILSKVNPFLIFDKYLQNIIFELFFNTNWNFFEKIQEKVKLISQENIKNIFLKVEMRTEHEIPEEIKLEVLSRFLIIEEIVNKALLEQEAILKKQSLDCKNRILIIK